MIRKANAIVLLLATGLISGCSKRSAPMVWSIDSTEQWQSSCTEQRNLSFDDGLARPTARTSTYRSKLMQFDAKRSPQRMVFRQSAQWLNWQRIDNLGPSNLGDAPVLLAMGPHDYWIFGRYRKPNTHANDFQATDATLEGFDIPLKTTPFAHQYDAPGGLEPGLGGYHAWQSRDMVNWVHHGPVTEKFSCWVTTAEQVDGKTYIYYDYPNDQDPHVYVDDDLTDGKPGKNMGMAFKDPSDGSDCTMIRDLEGKFHVIYEDWSPINARTHSWDSPLAGHAVSDDGLKDFAIRPPAVDRRTTPTGKMATYHHPHWLQHPDWDSNVATYQVHEPEQDAFGDWAAIAIGGQYYLFCDYHPAGDRIRLGWFTSPSIDEPFTFCGELGLGHPDPDIIFAEGRFYLITQTKTDYISPGPWVDSVEARVGIDTNNDGTPETWTRRQQVSERYDYIEGLSKQIKRTDAAIDLSDLPPCFGFCFEVRTTDTTDNPSGPVLDGITITFEQQ